MSDPRPADALAALNRAIEAWEEAGLRAGQAFRVMVQQVAVMVDRLGRDQPSIEAVERLRQWPGSSVVPAERAASDAVPSISLSDVGDIDGAGFLGAHPAPAVVEPNLPNSEVARIVANVSRDAAAGGGEQGQPKPAKRTSERRQRLVEMLMPSGPKMTRMAMVAELNGLPGALITGDDVSVWINQQRLREAAAAAESARAVLDAEPLPAPAPVSLQPEADPVQPDDEVLHPPPDAAAPLDLVEADPAPVLPPEDAVPVTIAMIVARAAGLRTDPPAAVRPAPAEVRADDSYIRNWAAERGIPQSRHISLPQVNKRRRDLGLPAFADPRAVHA